jgi:hypothetical protein
LGACTRYWSAPIFALVSLVACGRPVAYTVSPASEPARHVQIVHAMTTSERQALVARFHQRNPTDDPSRWEVNEDALTLSVVVVDPFKGFLRRARRPRRPTMTSTPSRGPDALGTRSRSEAAIAARSFVKRNADLLGLPPSVVIGLAEDVKPADARVGVPEPGIAASPRPEWTVHFDARFASKGYEGFHEIDNIADLDVSVDDDGEVSAFVNRSRVHPRLSLDVRPNLARDDPRVVAKLVGRRLFALVDDAGHSGDVREQRRLPLGEIGGEDVTHVELVVHVWPGPQLAWLTYRLAYFVEVAKPANGSAPSPIPRTYFFFRYVVDADTGDVIEDSRAPVAAAAEPDLDP